MAESSSSATPQLPAAAKEQQQNDEELLPPAPDNPEELTPVMRRKGLKDTYSMPFTDSDPMDEDKKDDAQDKKDDVEDKKDDINKDDLKQIDDDADMQPATVDEAPKKKPRKSKKEATLEAQ